MNVLIAESNTQLGEVWCSHFARHDIRADLVNSVHMAINEMRLRKYDALIVSLQIEDSSVLAISDMATYRNPDIAIILVTSDTFFSDGSIFNLVPNARSFVNETVAPDDLAAIVDHYATATPAPGV